MASPILLVADDLPLMAAVRRVLAREGYECLVATSVADAVIAWGDALPGLVLLQPSVESGRGGLLLEELRRVPDAPLLRVLLLGESIPGYPWPVEPLPLDAAHLVAAVEEAARASERPSDWRLGEAEKTLPPQASVQALAPDAWRATRPPPGGEGVNVDAPPPPHEVRSSETGRHLTESLRSDPALVFSSQRQLQEAWPQDVSSPEGGALQPGSSAGHQEALDVPVPLPGRAAEPDERPTGSPPARYEVPTPVPGAPAESSSIDVRLTPMGAEGPPTPPRVAPTPTSALGPPGSVEALPRPRDASLTELDLEDLPTQPPGGELGPIGLSVEEEVPEAPVAPEVRVEPAMPIGSQVSAEALADQLFGDLGEELEPSLGDLGAPGDLAWAYAGREASSGPAPVAEPGHPAGVLARAEAMVQEGRASFVTSAAAEEDEQRASQAELTSAQERAESAEAQVEVAREERLALEEEVLRLRASVEVLERASLEARTSHAAALEAARAHAATALARREAELGAQVEVLTRRADGAEAELELVRAEVEAQDSELRQRVAELAEERRQTEERAAQHRAQLEALTREREERLAALGRERQERVAELSRQQAEAIAALTRRHDELVAELRFRLADAQATGEVAKAEAVAAQELSRQLSEEQAVHAEARRRLDDAEARLASLEAQLGLVEQSLAESEQARLVAEEEARSAASSAEELGHQVVEMEARLAAERAEREQQAAEDREVVAAELERLRAEAQDERAAERVAAGEALEQVRAELEAQRTAERVELLAQHETALAALRAELAATSLALDEAKAKQEAGARARAELEATLEEARAGQAALEAERVRLSEELERTVRLKGSLVQEVAALQDELALARTRAEGAEASAALAAGKVRELEHRSVMTLAIPGRPVLGVERHGTVGLDGLSRLVCQLVLGQADGHLELGVVGGARSLWLKKGQIVAAASSFDEEGLIDRARRDGLIDARQEADLRPLRGATLKEQLEALKARGYIRDVEAVPLVQRCAEQVALAALSEEETQYRLQDEAPSWEVVQVTIPRATLPLLAEALRRAVPVDSLLERLGGGDAVPVATDAELELRALGFSDRERRLLARVDGEATVEELCLESGLKSDVAFRTLEVAKLLGVIEVRAPERPRAKVDPELDVRRLEAKYDEVVDADYFAVLGLPRTAGADEVTSAWQRLSAEFHPLRFAGHPDAGLQQRAQVVFNLLEEAARALEDDRRRAEYARHLLD